MWSHASNDAVNVVSPKTLVQALGPALAKHGISSVLQQNDAHEVYTLMADSVTEVLKDEGSPFLGQTRQVVRCESCGALSIGKPESFTSISIDLVEKNDRGLDVLLATLFSPERVSGYHCDSCGDRSASAIKTCSLWKTSPVLVVALKRFGERLRSRVDELTPVLSSTFLRRLHDPSAPPATGSIGDYHLCSVVCHMGSERSGHYWTVAYKAHGRDATEASWNVYDDESVHACRDGSQAFLRDAYLLFYQRTI